MDRLTRTFTAERAADGRVTLSTETPCAQDGLVLRADGWDFSRFAKVAPKMFYNHSTSGSEDFPIGRWEDVQVRDGKLTARPVFAAEEHPERAGVIAKLWQGGFLDDVSVSFRVDTAALGPAVKHEDGNTYRESGKHELLECSVVGIGADPNAGKGRMAEAVTRGVITADEAQSLDAPEQTPAPVAEADSERIARLETEVAELRRVLETQAERIDRLDTQREQAEPPAPPEAAPVEEERHIEPEKSREQEIAEVIAAVKRRQLGRLPD